MCLHYIHIYIYVCIEVVHADLFEGLKALLSVECKQLPVWSFDRMQCMA